MAMLIIAEIMTPNLSDSEFQDLVLSRRKDGSVDFRADAINPMYSSFFHILQRGLHTDPKQRPDAIDLLYYFETMRKDSLTNLFHKNTDPCTHTTEAPKLSETTSCETVSPSDTLSSALSITISSGSISSDDSQRKTTT